MFDSLSNIYSKSLFASNRGATAIEYAIIAGLIGIGLVSSLVTTKGSLRGIFQTASSEMASANGGAAATPAPSPTPSQPVSNSPRAPFWQAKTLSFAPQSLYNGTTTRYTYTDGTVAEFSKFSSNFQTLTVRSSGAGSYIQTSPGSGPFYYSLDEYDQNGNTIRQSRTENNGLGSSFPGNPPTPNKMIVNQNGVDTTSLPTAPFLKGYSDTVNDIAYFNDISK